MGLELSEVGAGVFRRLQTVESLSEYPERVTVLGGEGTMHRAQAARLSRERRAAGVRSTLAGMRGCRTCRPVSHDDSALMSLGDVLGWNSMAPLRPYVPAADGFGQVLGLGALGSDTVEEPPEVFKRATNLAAITVLGLRRLAPENRFKALAEATGKDFAHSVGLTAKGLGMGLDDAVKASLALHYLMGILQADGGRTDTPYARAYLMASEAAKYGIGQAQAGAPASVPQPGAAARPLHMVQKPVNGLAGGLGLGMPSFITDAAHAVGNAISDGAKAVVHAAAAVGSSAQGLLDKVGDAVTGAMCAAFKKILGDTVGGILCTVFTKLIGMAKTMLQVAIEIGKIGFEMIGQIIEIVVGSDDWGTKAKKCAMALLTAVNEIIMLSMADWLVLILGYDTDERGRPVKGEAAIKKVRDLGKEVTKEAPLFVVGLIVAVIGAIGGAVIGVITALIPLFVVVGAVIVVNLLKKMGKVKPSEETSALQSSRDIIKQVIGIVQGIIQGAMEFDRVVKDMQAAAARTGGYGNATKEKVQGLKDRVGQAWNGIKRSFSTFPPKFKECMEAVGDLVGMPELAGKAIKYADNPASVKDDIGANWEELKKTDPAKAMDFAMKTAAGMSPADLMAATKNMNPADKAAMIRQSVANMPPADRASFLDAMRANGMQIVPV